MLLKFAYQDTAYSEKENILFTKDNQLELISKLHPNVTQGRRTKEEGFHFNKDAGLYVCKTGYMATFKKQDGKKGQDKNARIKYLFDIEKCKVCPFRKRCYTEGARTKSYSITIKSTEHLDQEAFQDTERFKNLAKNRYKKEAKNSELKHGHGYETATSTGLFDMEIQGATTIFAVNLKRIIKLLQEKE